MHGRALGRSIPGAQQLGHRSVQAVALRERETRVDSGAQERMMEPEQCARGEESRSDELVGGRRSVRRSDPREHARELEWRVVAEHPKIGQVVLEQAGALRDAATIVLHHHEWYDGRGYPHGLAGGEIPIGARIVSIVDAYEAMIAGRPYRAAISHEEAIAELRRQAGVQFDPELVEVFAIVFATGMPWEPEAHEHQHDHEHEYGVPAEEPADVPAAAMPAGRAAGRARAVRGRSPSTAELHDSVHERRRRAV